MQVPDDEVRVVGLQVERRGGERIAGCERFYVGRVPIFYWPYLYQSLDDDSSSFVVSPAYMSSWGPSLLGRVTFPLTNNIFWNIATCDC